MPGSVLCEKQSGFLQAYPFCPLWEELRTRKCGEQYYNTTLGCFYFFLANGYTLWGRVEGKCVRTYGTFQSGFTWLLSQYYERDLVTVKALFQKAFCFLLPFKKPPFNLPKWWEKERVLREKLVWPVPLSQCDHPLLLCPKAKIEKGLHWLPKEKLFSGLGGRAGELRGKSGHLPTSETASCVRRKHEKLEGRKMRFLSDL